MPPNMRNMRYKVVEKAVSKGLTYMLMNNGNDGIYGYALKLSEFQAVFTDAGYEATPTKMDYHKVPPKWVTAYRQWTGEGLAVSMDVRLAGGKSMETWLFMTIDDDVRNHVDFNWFEEDVLSGHTIAQLMANNPSTLWKDARTREPPKLPTCASDIDSFLKAF